MDIKVNHLKSWLCVRWLMYSRCWREENSRGCFSSREVVLGFLGGTAQQGGLRVPLLVLPPQCYKAGGHHFPLPS